jgi:Raf kinase inhibitor-like YbhB/YbcL family protein
VVLTRTLGLVLALLAVTACGKDGSPEAPAPTATRSLTVTSPAFREGGPIPSTYTCHGRGVSPELRWSTLPQGTDAALVVDDPDAPGGDYVHWVVTGIPASVDGVEAGSAPPGAHEVDGTGGPGWKPPCPPSGTHHYRFTVYAVPSDPRLPTGGSVGDLVAALARAAVAWGRLTGTVSAG